MKFKHKLRMFLFPAILLPAVVVMAVNFIITGYKIRDMEYELLGNKVKYIIEKCDSAYNMIKALGMEHVDFYREATKRLILEEVQKNMTTSGAITIVDTRSHAIVFSITSEEQRFLHDPQSIQRMVHHKNGIGEYVMTSQAGNPITTMTAFGVYANWNWLVIGYAEIHLVYRYLYDAMTVSSLVVGLLLMLFLFVMYRWSNGISKSLELLEQGTIRLVEHDFDVAIEIPGNDEFGHLAKSFTVMASAIKKAQRELTIAVRKTEEANQELAESLQWNEAIITSIPDLLFTLDQAGMFLDCQASDPNLLFLPQALFLGKNIADVMPPLIVTKTMQATSTTLANGTLQTFEYDLEMPQGHRWFESRVMRLTENTVLAIARDITDRRRTEEQIREHNRLLEQAVQEKQREMEELFERLLRQEKLATIGQMAGSIAHELRNPLGAVKQSVYYLKRLAQTQALTASNPKVQRHLDLMDAELNASERVIADLFEMTRLKPPQRQPTDLRALIAEAVQRCALPEQVRVNLTLEPEPFVIYADPLQMRQVLLNVLTNAVQAIEGEGMIAIHARQLREQAESAIEIHNTGVAIAPEALSRVFEPLYTTKATGTGLGLSICKQIIENHQGRISLTSQPGQGTTVTIVLSENDRDSS